MGLLLCTPLGHMHVQPLAEAPWTCQTQHLSAASAPFAHQPLDADPRRARRAQVFFSGPPLLKGSGLLPSHGDDFSPLQSSAVKTAVAVWPLTLSPFLPPDSLMVRPRLGCRSARSLHCLDRLATSFEICLTPSPASAVALLLYMVARW